MRILDFTDGFTSASAPDIDSIAPTITGSRASPTSITALGGITASTGNEIQFVQGSGGAVDITANPQISAGNFTGQSLTLVGRHDTNTVKLEDGTGLELNGACTLSAASVITLMWDGTKWTEVNRNDI